MSKTHIEIKIPLTRTQVMEQIKVGDKLNGQPVTEKVWSRNAPGYLRAHIVSAGDLAENTMEFNSEYSFAARPGLLNTDDIFEGKRVSVDYVFEDDAWYVKEQHIDLVDVTKLHS